LYCIVLYYIIYTYMYGHTHTYIYIYVYIYTYTATDLQLETILEKVFKNNSGKMVPTGF